jgi:hypothetical protein
MWRLRAERVWPLDCGRDDRGDSLEGKAMQFKLLLPAATILLCTLGSQTLAAAPVVVTCGPGQHAIVRDTFVRGQAVTQVECVRGSAYRPTVYRTRGVVRSRHRSWGKTALVIGGSAATGAGIGGIVHGKKGALIGAALGGGVASLYEGAHRR